MMEKLGGVKEVSMEGRGSLGNQVSERAKISILSVRIKSCRRAGLFSKGVMEEAEQMLR
jgi:hypothetical protein